ncbi:MAG: hypothetical protein LBF92_00945 [Synergistaceae bacterium]|jgi:hypothetical protein|nr:hypothetical protein [Synergistaceae bacterium]
MDRDDEKILRVTNKELFYSAMLLGFGRLVGVEYFFPTEEKALSAELEEAKRTLHKKRLLKENSKGEISLDPDLTKCIGLCSNPERCTVVDSGGIYAIIYEINGENMILERTGEEENAVRFFEDRDSATGYARNMLENAAKEGAKNVHS